MKGKVIPWLDIGVAVLKGAFVSFLLLVLLLFLAAVAISQGIISQEKMVGIVLASVVLSSLIGGFLALSIVKKYGLLLGIAVGVVLVFFLVLLGLCFYPETFSLSGEILFAALCGGAMTKLFPVHYLNFKRKSKK
ncbi:MAG: TIGR04086 family membrane protein [Eubacteriales bacterium]